MKLFKSTRFMHVPTTITGYIIYALSGIFLITVFIAVDRKSHSISDTLYGIFPYFAATFLLTEWFASKTSN